MRIDDFERDPINSTVWEVERFGYGVKRALAWEPRPKKVKGVSLFRNESIIDNISPWRVRYPGSYGEWMSDHNAYIFFRKMWVRHNIDTPDLIANRHGYRLVWL